VGASTLHKLRQSHHELVISTEADRRFSFTFAPAKVSVRAVEKSLFDLSPKLGDAQGSRYEPGSSRFLFFSTLFITKSSIPTGPGPR